MSTCSDQFFDKHFSITPRPPHVPLALQKGDRLLLIGDSITEAPRHAQMLETYLTVCRPELEVQVRNIGKGGETIRSITEETGAEINIEDDGTVTIACSNIEGTHAALATIKTLLAKPEVGTTYLGKVRDVRDELGAFVEFLPKTDGLVHISEISSTVRVAKVSDHLKIGDRVKVKLVDVRKDPRTGKTRFALSMKAVEIDAAKGEQKENGQENN